MALSLRQHTLELTHEEHPGEIVMKRRPRAKVCWLNALRNSNGDLATDLLPCLPDLMALLTKNQ